MERESIKETSELSRRIAENELLLLDGATGTELERRGAPAALPLWSAHALVEDPALVEEIHDDYARAGADALTANTFRTQRRALARGGLGERAAELSALAVTLARRAAERAPRRVHVLGSAPPLEDCYRPDLVPEAVALAREHAEHADNLAAAGADAVLVETMNTIREAVAAAGAARRAGLPSLVSFACGEGARLLSGELLAEAVAAVLPEEPRAVLVNCLPASRVAACLDVLREVAGRRGGLPFGVYANLGAPIEDADGARTEALSPEAFALCCEEWIADGARIVGGCCGTEPAHVRAAADRMRAGDRRLDKVRPG